MADFELLRSLGTIKHVRKDEAIFMEDDDGEDMFIVLKGVFGVYVNSFVDVPVRVADIGPQSFFGEMAVIDGSPRSATIIADEDGALLAIEKSNFRLLIEKSPEIAESILKTLRTRAESTAETARNKGKYVPPIPSPAPEDQGKGGVDAKIALMTLLAQYIRQTNGLLYEQPICREHGKITLLPHGFKLFNVKDLNDNKRALRLRKATCPLCGRKSEVYVPDAANIVQIRADLDGRVIYKDFDILLYSNIVCPNCKYTDNYREFFKQIPTAVQQKITDNQFVNTENFTGFAVTHEHTVDEAILSFYLNITCLELTTHAKSGLLRLAKAWMSLYWMFGDLGAADYRKQAAGEAADLYAEYLGENAETLQRQDELRINGILGELHAAMGNRSKAEGYLEANALLGGNTMAEKAMVEESLNRFRELRGLK